VMPSKRPAPLSDAALAPRRTRDIGETNAGVPLPVKNTFIDVPSGLTPTGMHSASAARGQAISTAPAQVSFGFMKRAVLASSQAQGTPAAMVPATPSSPLSPTRFAAALRGTQVQPTSPRRVPALAVQRPSYTLDRSQILGQLPQTPLATPSPMGHNSLFSAERYQLFGGPAPVQEATHSAIAPTGGTCVLSTQGLSGPTVVSLSATQAPLPAGPLTSAMVGHMSTGPQTSMAVSSSMPVSSAPFTVVSSTTARSPATTVKLADGACGSRSAAVISTVQYARPAAAGALKAQRLNAVEQEAGSKDSHSEGDDDGDDDSDEGDQPKINIEDAPKPPPGALHPSLGSANHSEGTCKRCCFFPRNRCLNGYNCEFCHYEHEKRKRKSKKSKKKGKDSAAAADTETCAFGAGCVGPCSARKWTTATSSTVGHAWQHPAGKAPPADYSTPFACDVRSCLGGSSTDLGIAECDVPVARRNTRTGAASYRATNSTARASCVVLCHSLWVCLANSG